MARLNEGLDARLTLISAPAGFGKTTLLSEWIPHSPRCVVWVSLDAGDNDPIRFWTYGIATLQLLQPSLGQAALALLQSPQTPALEPILTNLLNDITAFPDEFILVFDDYHVIENPALHDSLTYVLDHLPRNMHLTLTGRADPALPLARLRARRQLAEIRAADLRFTFAEAAVFLNEVMGLSLSAEDITALETRTEGWIAGLQLAALSMQGRSDVASFINAFTGSHVYIVDYLAEEVLHRQPDKVQTFLLQTSILERLSGRLCDAVTGQADSQDVLEKLQRNNLFIIPLDDKRHWYRYHHLFAEVLRARLQKATSAATGTIAELHQRASAWYEQQGLMTEAVEHALAGGIFEQAARLIEQMGMLVFGQGAIHYVLNKWLAALPVELIRLRPKLGLIQAWLLFNRMDPEATLHWLDEAEQALQREDRQDDNTADARNTQGEIAVTRAIATTLSRRFDPDQVKRWAQEALAYLRPDNASYRGLVFGTLGHAAMQQGDVAQAEQALTEAVTISRVAGHEYMALATAVHLTNIQRARGSLSLAIATSRQAFEWAAEHEAQTTFGAGNLLVQLADLLRERNDLAAALHYATSGVALSHQGAHPVLFLVGSLVLIRIKQALGDLKGGFELLGQIRQTAAKLYHAEWLLALLPAVEARLHLAQGDLPAALRWANSIEWVETLPPHFRSTHHFVYAYEYGSITRAQVLIAQAWSRSAAALARTEQTPPPQDPLPDVLTYLDRQGQVAETTGLMWLRLKVYILQALAYHVLGDAAQAMEKLEQALPLAEPEGYIRIFVDEGAPMATVLGRMKAEGGRWKEYIRKLLLAFEESEGRRVADGVTAEIPPFHPSSSPGAPRSAVLHPLVEPLTPRELEVLRLMAAGHSNQEIAQRLIVSVGTVKKHLNNIFGKLNATSRTQAVARARELQLL
jgi:LuxR family maltose regulon positive regulatory protein